MAGLLTHLCFGFAGFIIIYLLFYNTKPKKRIVYGLVFILGNIFPDLIDFGFLSIKMISLNPEKIMENPYFDTLALFGHTFLNWIIMAIILFGVIILLYSLKKISKENLIAGVILILLILIGVLIHLKLDYIINETNYWI